MHVPKLKLLAAGGVVVGGGVADALAKQYGDRRVGRYITVTPLRDALIGNELRLTSLLFLGVVGFVLLMCCANVANLLLARGTSTGARELALRSALGAGRRRIIVPHLLTERSCWLNWRRVGRWNRRGDSRVWPRLSLSRPTPLRPGAISLAFEVAGCWCSAAVTTLLVAAYVGRLRPGKRRAFHSCKLGADQRHSNVHQWKQSAFRQLLVVAEIAAAVMLLCGAGLLLRTLLTLPISRPCAFRSLPAVGSPIATRHRAFKSASSTEAFVQRYLGGRNPIGIRLTLLANVVREAVGVAREIVTLSSICETPDLAPGTCTAPSHVVLLHATTERRHRACRDGETFLVPEPRVQFSRGQGSGARRLESRRAA